MKTSVTWIATCVGTLLFAAVCSRAPAASASENDTAYRAIRVARAALGAQELDRLVEVTGHDGVPQPYVWKIVLKEGANSSREIDVADGKIVAQRALERPAAATEPVKLTALNLDSSGAFDAADSQARKVHVRFDSINYTLHGSEKTGKPVWTMELFDRDGVGVGAMRLTATDGTIASIEGRLAEGPGRPGEPLTANATVPASHTVSATTTTTVETAPAPPPPPPPPTQLAPSEPPPVHDVDVSTTQTEPDTEGGFFTRAGRTLDHTHDNVVRSLDQTHDNVVRSLDTAHDNVAHAIDTAHAKVDHSLRATGATLQRFFTGHSDLDNNE